MAPSLTEISKFLSYILRHKPDAIDLKLDTQGWANIKCIIEKSDIALTEAIIREVVASSDKKRFIISDDGLCIRANQGHSIDIDLGLKPNEPPEILYHGTANRFLDEIKIHGLLPKNRQYVHLSDNVETAMKVGQRHGKAVVLSIPARSMHKSGHLFFRSENGVWLTKAVPIQFIPDLTV